MLGREVLQWTTATQVDANTWDLSGLLRGRKGTEWAVSGHTAGERFVVLSAATTCRVPRDSGELNSARFYRAVTVGSNLSLTPSQSFTNTGIGKTPYAPVHLMGSRRRGLPEERGIRLPRPCAWACSQGPSLWVPRARVVTGTPGKGDHYPEITHSPQNT